VRYRVFKVHTALRLRGAYAPGRVAFRLPHASTVFCRGSSPAAFALSLGGRVVWKDFDLWSSYTGKEERSVEASGEAVSNHSGLAQLALSAFAFSGSRESDSVTSGFSIPMTIKCKMAHESGTPRPSRRLPAGTRPPRFRLSSWPQPHALTPPASVSPRTVLLPSLRILQHQQFKQPCLPALPALLKQERDDCGRVAYQHAFLSSSLALY